MHLRFHVIQTAPLCLGDRHCLAWTTVNVPRARNWERTVLNHHPIFFFFFLVYYRYLITMRLSCALQLVCAMLALVLLVWSADAAQSNLRLRPSPSEHLPVPDLKEDPDPEYDPREQDLSERTLRKKLGSGFESDFMSVSAPAQLLIINATTTTTTTASPGSSTYVHAPSGAMPAEIRRLDLTQTPYGLRVKMGKKARRKFLQWLWTHTHCPVMHVWKDLGVRFWPRYVKEGHCFSERSCSLPEGMFCKPAKSVTKTFLRWYCQGFLPQKYCTWIPVHYPIISECKCSC